MSTVLRGRLDMLVAAALFSTGGAAIKACTLSSWQVASFRSGVACLAVLVFLPDARLGIGRSALLVGAAYAATMVLFVLSNKLTTAAAAIFLQYTAPLYIVLAGPWLLEEPIRRRDLALLGVMGVGLSLFFLGNAPIASAPRPILGNVLALFSGVTWATTAMGLRWIARSEGEARATTAASVLLGNIFAFLACLPAALPATSARPTDWLLVGYLGVFQIGGAYYFLTRGLRELPALEASMLLLLEPALNPVWAWIFQRERLGLAGLAGAGILLAATAFKTWDDTRRRASSLPNGITAAPEAPSGFSA
jgi:drug/metabolite transporter (DMT)-like permease